MMVSCMHYAACMYVAGYACMVFCSSEVLLACRFKIWGGSNIDERLERAYASFNAWRIANKETTSLSKFELKTFKMTSCLSCKHFSIMHDLFVCACVCMFDIAVDLNRSDQVAMPSTGMWKGSWHDRVITMALGYVDKWLHAWRTCPLIQNLTSWIALGCTDMHHIMHAHARMRLLHQMSSPYWNSHFNMWKHILLESVAKRSVAPRCFMLYIPPATWMLKRACM